MAIAVAPPIELPIVRAVVCEAEAVPRRSGGTADMITAVLGELKVDMPMPSSNMRMPKSTGEVLASVMARSASAVQTISIPAVVSGREPRRSERRPENGDQTSIAMDMGMIIRAASIVEKPRALISRNEPR